LWTIQLWMTDSEMNVLKSSDRLKQEIKCMRFIDFHRILYTVRIPLAPHKTDRGRNFHPSKFS